MSTEEYYLAFESILNGLIISRILLKWSEMIRNEASASFDWAYMLITVNIFILIIYFFWVNRQPEHYENIDGPGLFLLHVVLPPSIFTFMTFQLFPNNIHQVFQGNYLVQYRKLIFIPWAIYLFYNVAVLSDNLLNPIGIFTLLMLALTLLIVWKPLRLLIYTFHLLTQHIDAVWLHTVLFC